MTSRRSNEKGRRKGQGLEASVALYRLGWFVWLVGRAGRGDTPKCVKKVPVYALELLTLQGAAHFFACFCYLGSMLV